MAFGRASLLPLMMAAMMGAGVSSTAPPPPPPHIILMVADDLGWNDVSWHNEEVVTPQLEALARGGVLLEQSYVLPLCTPTRSALLSGRYPFTIGRQHLVLLPMMPAGLDLNLTLLPQSLRAAGYSTHAVGKWHLGYCSWDYTPTERGFDTFYGFYNAAEFYYTHSVPWRSMGVGESTVEGYDFRNNTEADHSAEGIYSTYLFASYVEKLLSSRDPEEPLFLYLPFQSVHAPNEVPDNYTEPYSHIQDEQRRIKLGMVTAMDEAVGRVVAALKETGHYDNSIIVFTTDNGASTFTAGNNWPLRGNKTTLWEGGTRGVAFVHSPLLPNPGTVSTQLFHVTDWYQTLMGVAGGVAPPDTDGVDQWAAITGAAPSPRTKMVYNINNTWNFTAGVRIGDFKLLVGNPGPGQWTPPPEYISTGDYLTSNQADSGCHGLKTSEVEVVETAQDEVLENEKAAARVLPEGENISNSSDVSAWSQSGEAEGQDDSEAGVEQLLQFLNITMSEIRLFNIADDPEERVNVALLELRVVRELLEFLLEQMPRYVPADIKPDDPNANPANWNNEWTPGWC